MATDNPARIFGIDLGTTYSCISYVDENGRTVVVPGDNSQLVTPSVVFFESESNVIVGQAGKDSALVYPEKTVEMVKRYMGDPDWKVELDGKTYRPEDISALILRKVAKFAEDETGSPVTDVVITTPAYFNSDQRTATENAGKLAGLNVHAIIPEPTAAAISYSISDATNQTVMVYDLGGGTFDVAVIDVSEGQITVVCTDGDHSLGGRDWDNMLVRHFAAEWQNETGSAEDPFDDPLSAQDFQDRAEQAKRNLTGLAATPVSLQHGGQRARVELTREKFDELTRSLLDRTIELTRRVMEVAGDEGKGDIAKILLVGGSTYMPQVKARLEAEFDIPMELYDPDQSVAKGAAIYAANKQIQQRFAQSISEMFPGVGSASDLNEEQKTQVAGEVARSLRGVTPSRVLDVVDQKIINTSSKSFGIVAVNDDGEDEIVYLIKKNSQVPAEKRERFGTVVDDQETVNIRVIEASGDSLPDSELLPPHSPGADPLPFPIHARQIETKALEMPPGLPARSPILVRYFLSEDGGRLEVDAEEESQGRKISIEVDQVNALSEQEVAERQQVQNALTVL